MATQEGYEKVWKALLTASNNAPLRFVVLTPTEMTVVDDLNSSWVYRKGRIKGPLPQRPSEFSLALGKSLPPEQYYLPKRTAFANDVIAMVATDYQPLTVFSRSRGAFDRAGVPLRGSDESAAAELDRLARTWAQHKLFSVMLSSDFRVQQWVQEQSGAPVLYVMIRPGISAAATSTDKSLGSVPLPPSSYSRTYLSRRKAEAEALLIAKKATAVTIETVWVAQGGNVKFMNQGKPLVTCPPTGSCELS